MPKDLRHRLGRIDVEVERGYIDYSSKDDPTNVFTVPGASESKWFASQKHGRLYRTQYEHLSRLTCFRTLLTTSLDFSATKSPRNCQFAMDDSCPENRRKACASYIWTKVSLRI